MILDIGNLVVDPEPVVKPVVKDALTKLREQIAAESGTPVFNKTLNIQIKKVDPRKTRKRRDISELLDINAELLAERDAIKSGVVVDEKFTKDLKAKRDELKLVELKKIEEEMRRLERLNRKPDWTIERVVEADLDNIRAKAEKRSDYKTLEQVAEEEAKSQTPIFTVNRASQKSIKDVRMKSFEPVLDTSVVIQNQEAIQSQAPQRPSRPSRADRLQTKNKTFLIEHRKSAYSDDMRNADPVEVEPVVESAPAPVAQAAPAPVAAPTRSVFIPAAPVAPAVQVKPAVRPPVQQVQQQQEEEPVTRQVPRRVRR
ncbi:MAG: hypothetical protein EBZ49_01950 [Proteobacteria bacterium]|nr:hypothetical protein [Pseudomonadota bacterium]